MVGWRRAGGCEQPRARQRGSSGGHAGCQQAGCCATHAFLQTASQIAARCGGDTQSQHKPAAPLTSPRRASRGTPSGWPAVEGAGAQCARYQPPVQASCMPEHARASKLSSTRCSGLKAAAHLLELVVLGHHLRMERGSTGRLGSRVEGRGLAPAPGTPERAGRVRAACSIATRSWLPQLSTSVHTHLDALEGAHEDARLHRGQAPPLHVANLLVPAGSKRGRRGPPT